MHLVMMGVVLGKGWWQPHGSGDCMVPAETGIASSPSEACRVARTLRNCWWQKFERTLNKVMGRPVDGWQGSWLYASLHRESFDHYAKALTFGMGAKHKRPPVQGESWEFAWEKKP
jgi:hypothetical protein